MPRLCSGVNAWWRRFDPPGNESAKYLDTSYSPTNDAVEGSKRRNNKASVTKVINERLPHDGEESRQQKFMSRLKERDLPILTGFREVR